MRALILLWMMLMAGCASTPQASRDDNAESQRYYTHPGYATLYVYRTPFGGSFREESVLYLDGRIIGATLPGAYFRIDTRPGERVLHGFGHDQGWLKVSARSGEIAFVSLNVMDGSSHFEQVSPEAGKLEIARCCALLENWAPGQRPFLR